MEVTKNSNLLKDQLKKLLYQVKDLDQNEIEVNINLQIFSFKETERDNKKVYIMTLCDNEYKYSSFFLACSEKVENLEKGNIIHLKEVSPKKIKAAFFIRIKDYEILEKSSEIENA